MFDLIILSLLSCLIIICCPARFLKETGFFTSVALLVVSLWHWVMDQGAFGLVTPVFTYFQVGLYNVYFSVDALSYFFILLTTFITFLCVLAAFFSVRQNLRFYLSCLFFLELLLIAAFSVLDFFFFYIFFESVLLPMYLIIGFWGSNVRRVKAGYYLFLYTLSGSLCLLVALILIGFQVGTYNWHILVLSDFSMNRELLLWPLIFIAFAVKVPMFPFHVWLPEAHVEAPTGGSVILASLLLKLGTYGFLRYLLPVFPYASLYYSSFVVVLALLSVFYASFIAIRQVDIKRIIAYSSIAHMNFGVVGLFSFTYEGLLGGYYLMLGHGLISGALFFLIGVLYDRYKSRILFNFSGLVTRMPLFVFFFFFFNISNIAFPGTFNFVSEFLVLVGTGATNFVTVGLLLISLFFTTIFTFWLYNRVAFGTSRVFFDVLRPISLRRGTVKTVLHFDLLRSEFFILLYLACLTFLFGLFPLKVLVFFTTGFYLFF